MSQKYKVYINNRPKTISHNWNDFCSRYKIIEASGGVVYNEDNQLLMIFRNGRWDLPKGKIECGEDVQACAIREVQEETGVFNLVIIRELTDTYHTYLMNKKRILKKTYWFTMSSDYKEQFKPQIKENITIVNWIKIEEIPKLLEKSYKNIKRLINKTIEV